MRGLGPSLDLPGLTQEVMALERGEKGDAGSLNCSNRGYWMKRKHGPASKGSPVEGQHESKGRVPFFYCTCNYCIS